MTSRPVSLYREEGKSAHVDSIHHLNDGKIIFRQPKSAKSRRSIALPPSVVLILKEHQEKRKNELAAMGQKFSEDSLVFCHYDGTPLHPDTLSRVWPDIAKRAGLKPICLHGARHTHATLILKQGTHPKIVQERLGHATIAVTLDTYSHIVPGLQDAAAKKFDGLDLLPKRNTKRVLSH